MGLRSLWMAALMDELTIGPMPYHVAVDWTSKRVPPGRAYRETVDIRGRHRASRTGHIIKKPPHYYDQEYMVYIGGRYVARHTILEAVRRGTLESFYDQGVRWIALASKKRGGSQAERPADVSAA
jgi:hypothetical protein